jgi:hypothetical protein
MARRAGTKEAMRSWPQAQLRWTLVERKLNATRLALTTLSLSVRLLHTTCASTSAQIEPRSLPGDASVSAFESVLNGPIVCASGLRPHSRRPSRGPISLPTPSVSLAFSTLHGNLGLPIETAAGPHICLLTTSPRAVRHEHCVPSALQPTCGRLG